MSAWSDEICPSCQCKNWIDHGDMSDLTAPDRTGFVCWNCGKNVALIDGDNYECEPHVVEEWDDNDSGIHPAGLKQPS